MVCDVYKSSKFVNVVKYHPNPDDNHMAVFSYIELKKWMKFLDDSEIDPHNSILVTDFNN